MKVLVIIYKPMTDHIIEMKLRTQRAEKRMHCFQVPVK
jgi:hypothetical protein